MAAGCFYRLDALRAENDRLADKLAQLRLVDRAKCFLIEHRGLTEAEAHRLIEKQAMDTRRSRAQVAQDVLDSLDPDAVDGV
jgi:response regulator NasT